MLNTDNLIYTKPLCPYCARAKGVLRTKGIAFTEIVAAGAPQLEAEVRAKRGVDADFKLTWPQIFIGGVFIGGSDDLVAAVNAGDLQKS